MSRKVWAAIAVVGVIAGLAVVGSSGNDEDGPKVDTQTERDIDTLQAAWNSLSSLDRLGLCEEYDVAPNLTIRTLTDADVSVRSAEVFLDAAC